MSGRNPFRMEMEGRTLAKSDKTISQDCLGDVEGDLVGLQGRRHLLSMKIKQPLSLGAGSPEGQRAAGTEALSSHRFKFVDALLRVALSDLPQRFVFVSACFHVLCV